MKEAPPMHVTVTDSVYLTVDRAWGPPNFPAMFTAHVDGAPGMYINSGWFYADTGGYSRQLTWCPWGSFGTTAGPCGYNIPVSGKVVAEVSLNGSWRYPSKHVRVIPCPTGDTLLDNPKMRDLIKIVWDSSKTEESNGANRLERMGVLLYDTVTHKYSNMLLPLNSDPTKNGPCSVKPGTFALPINSRLVTYVHSHPWKDSTQFAGNCPKDANGNYLMYASTALTGWGSGYDWAVSRRVHLPSYIVDFKRIIRIVGDSGNVQPLRDSTDAVMLDTSGDTLDFTASNWPNVQRTYQRTPQCTYMAARNDPYLVVASNYAVALGSRRVVPVPLSVFAARAQASRRIMSEHFSEAISGRGGD